MGLTVSLTEVWEAAPGLPVARGRVPQRDLLLPGSVGGARERRRLLRVQPAAALAQGLGAVYRVPPIQ